MEKDRLGRISRRQALKAIGLSPVRIIVNAACQQPPAPEKRTQPTTPSPIAVPTPFEARPTQLPESEWAKRPAVEQIRELRKKDFAIKGVSKRAELEKAVPKYICEVAECIDKVDELRKKAHFLPPREFVNRYMQTKNLTSLTPEETQKVITQALDLRGNNEIIFNEAFFQNALTRLKESKDQNDIQYVKEFEAKGVDIEMIARESMLLTAYADLLAPQDEARFRTITVYPNQPNSLKIDRRKGLTFLGSTQQGDPIEIDGTKKAMIEVVSELLFNLVDSEHIGLYFPRFSAAAYHADTYRIYSQRAGLDPYEFVLRYSKPGFMEYLQDKWVPVLEGGAKTTDPQGQLLSTLIRVGLQVKDLEELQRAPSSRP